MKIKEIINDIKKNYNNECWVSVQDLAENIGLNVFIDKENEKIKAYYFVHWLCTDTHVGGKIYYYEDDPVAISWQQTRKGDEDLYWLNKDAFIKVKDYLFSLCEFNLKCIDKDEDLEEKFNINKNKSMPFFKSFLK